jgi:signal transduction histidine kinase/CheY-like chemotaxis protein
MTSPAPHESSAPLADILRTRREEILARFVEEVRRIDLPPDELSSPTLVDHLPLFLDEIVERLDFAKRASMTGELAGASSTARQHGAQRGAVGYDLSALVREYGVLRHCVLETVREAGGRPTTDEFDIFAQCVTVGISEAAEAYTNFRNAQLDEEKERMRFLIEAGDALSSSLDYRSTLSRVTSLLVPRLADWCAVHIDGTPPAEMPIAHVEPAKVSVLREIYERFPLPSDAAYGYPQVRRTGNAQLVEALPDGFIERYVSDAEHLALLRQVAARSWMTVPLRVQGTMFGALTLAYTDSGRVYGEAELALVTELARRMAGAIDKARLYEHSQNERSRVEAATRAKDEFVAMVSHELRTPLNAILGWVRLIRGGKLTEEKRDHAFEVIERNAIAQNQLVSDLLDISKIVTGKLRINLAQVDLANVIDMAIEGVRPAAEAKRITVTADLDRTAAVLRGDGDRLQQVIWNLLSNAVKFTPKGGSVFVHMRRVSSELEVEVRDTGEGIQESFLPYVFESFRQSDSTSARQHGGLGIGLSIARHILELHGGSIRVTSDGPGKGASFVVRLPVSALVSRTLGVPRVPATTEEEPRASALPVSLEGVRVLLVDDEADARELVAYVLESCGGEVRTAASVAEALVELDAFAPDVVISDIGMPQEDGYALVRRMRTWPAEDRRSIPAIALTAFARSSDRTRALVEGFNLHLAKPVEPMALVRAVEELLGRR